MACAMGPLRSGCVRTVTRSVTPNGEMDSTCTVGGVSSTSSACAGSVMTISTVARTTVTARSRSSLCATGMSTVATAQPVTAVADAHDRAVGDVPDDAVVVAEPGHAQADLLDGPVAKPVSMTSPTPYWSSRIMKTPVRKSLIRLWAPKPTAMPTTPALARIGSDVDAECRQHRDEGDGEDDERRDALEQRADGARPLTHPFDRLLVAHPDRRPGLGAGDLRARALSVNLRTTLVDQAVHDPPGDDGDDNGDHDRRDDLERPGDGVGRLLVQVSTTRVRGWASRRTSGRGPQRPRSARRRSLVVDQRRAGLVRREREHIGRRARRSDSPSARRGRRRARAQQDRARRRSSRAAARRTSCGRATGRRGCRRRRR